VDYAKPISERFMPCSIVVDVRYPWWCVWRKSEWETIFPDPQTMLSIIHAQPVEQLQTIGEMLRFRLGGHVTEKNIGLWWVETQDGCPIDRPGHWGTGPAAATTDTVSKGK